MPVSSSHPDVPHTTLHFEGFEGLALIADAYGPPEGAPVLFAHGGGQTRHAWGGTAKRLAADGYLAITLDLRGHGDSSWCPDKNYDLEFYARDLIAVSAGLSQRPHAVGASLGGLSAMLAEGLLAPGTFKSLTMVDITPRMEEEGVEQILNFMAAHAVDGFATLEEAADSVAAFLPHRERPKDTSGLAKNLRLSPDGRYRWHWDPAFVSSSRDAREERTVHNSHFLEEVAAKVKAPTHLIRGRLSQLVSEEAAREFLELVPHARFTDITGAGHMIAGDKNDAFTDAVLTFLQSV